MSRSPIRRVAPSAGKTGVERLEMENFARRLHQVMAEKGMSQSDLARAVWGEYEDKRGYKVAKNRDRISQYLQGRGYPEPSNLERICNVLGVEEADLAPDIVAGTIDRENPEIAMTAIQGHHDKVHLQINMLVPLAVASKVIGMLTDYTVKGNG